MWAPVTEANVTPWRPAPVMVTPSIVMLMAGLRIWLDRWSPPPRSGDSEMPSP